MSFANILFDDGSVSGDGIAVLTFNRPAKLNALNADAMRELDLAIGEVVRNNSIRGLILTGSGDRAFVAGADINELAARTPLESQRMSESGQATLRRMETMGKPTVAAINGFALGGGLEVAMACTVRFAAPEAKFGQPEVKLGIPPGFGGTQRLPRLVGRARALEMLLDGGMVDADTARRIGLVNRVYPAADLLEESRKWLRQVVQNAPVALQLVLQAVDVGLDCGLDAGLRFETHAFGVAAATEDRLEGTRAFVEKRKAVFSGK